MKELLRIRVCLTGQEKVTGGTEEIVMLPFTGRCDSPLFTGEILPGGVDTQRIAPDGGCALSARYALAGTDCDGKACRLFIENTAVSRPGQRLVTHPVVRTDSAALRWLETAALTGEIVGFEDHLDIVISSADTAESQHIALRRGGLTLRGCFEKKAEGKRPLVLMLHGFGGCMDAAPGGWFQRISDALTDAGLSTLRFDFDGHGQSEGAFCDMTPFSEIEDAAAFLRYALAREDVSEVYLLGHSQGGVIAGMLAGYYADRVKKLVMLTPAASLKTDAQQGRCMAARYDPQHTPEQVDVGNGRVVGGLYFRMARTLPIYEVTSQFGGPALAIIGGRDSVVSPEAIRRYGETMPDCQVLLKPTLDHGLGGEEYDEMLREVAAFLTK